MRGTLPACCAVVPSGATSKATAQTIAVTTRARVVKAA